MKIEYSAIALDSDSRYVQQNIAGDLMPVQSDGHETVNAAENRALGMFDSKGEVVRVLIRESIQSFAGGSWRAGRTMSYVDRPGLET